MAFVKSTTFMALLKFVDDEVNNKIYSFGIYIDLSKAFDTIDHILLRKKFQHYEVRKLSYTGLLVT